MLCRESELGWRLYKHRNGYAIGRTRVSFARRVWPLAPLLVPLLLVAVLVPVADATVRLALYALPGFLFVGLWLLRPKEVRIDLRSRVVVGRDFALEFPFSRVNVDTRYDKDAGVYGVYLRDAEPTNSTPPWQALAWEATTEAEANASADDFRDWGIGSPTQHPGSQAR